jgi:hypothetical protein
MTAFLIVCIVLMGIITLFDLVMLFSGDDDLTAIGVLHLIPEIVTLVALSIAL